MDFKKITEQQAEKILEKIENGFSLEQIVASVGEDEKEDVGAFVVFEMRLRKSIADIIPEKKVLRTIIANIPSQKKAIPSPRFAYSLFSPRTLGRIFAPVAVFALIFVLTTHDSPAIPLQTEEAILLTTSDTKRGEARMVKTVAPASVTPEEKRERAKAVIALLDEATPTIKQEESMYVSSGDETSLSALYE